MRCIREMEKFVLPIDSVRPLLVGNRGCSDSFAPLTNVE